ncbi:MAG: ABC transporter permease subunit [Planctomycetia bacterium]|nr:ABC transporter permease subunit [Planctomycetia bacterium]
MLSMITDLFGPIFAKEMVEMSRRWRYYQNRILFGAVVLLVLWLVYEESQWMVRIQGKTTVATLARMAEHFFLGYLWVQYLAVYIFVPFFLTGVISGEREQKTLDLLFTTQLTNREIIFGKLLSRVVSMVLLILSGVPIVAMTMLFGGVNAQVFVHALIATMVALLYVSSFAIYFSTTTKTTLGALIRTYWWMLCWLLVIPMLIFAGAEVLHSLEVMYQLEIFGKLSPAFSRDGIYFLALTIVCLINPLAMFVISVEDFTAMRISAVLGPWYFWWMLILPVLWSCLLIYLAMRRVRIEPGPGRLMQRIRRAITWVVNLILLKPVTSRLLKHLPKSKPDQWLWFPVENPLWQRSRRAFVYDRENHLQRAQLGGWILVILALVYLVTLDENFFRRVESIIVFMVWPWLGLAIMACLTAGICIVNDRRRGFLEFILVTPLEAHEVIFGTFLSVWRHVKKVYLLIITVMLLFVLADQVTFSNAVLSIFMGTLVTMGFVLHGITCSLVARSVTGALFAGFSLPVVTVILVPMVFGMFREDGLMTLWLLCMLLLPLAWLLTLWTRHAFTVSLLSIQVHLFLVCLCSCWIMGNSRNPYFDSISFIHPAMMTLIPLDRSTYEYSMRNQLSRFYPVLTVMYATGLALHLIWLFWWLCKNYETLSGRHEKARGSRRKSVQIKPQRETVAATP